MTLPLHIDNLKKHYRKTKAVDGISFDINENEIFALVGPNGAGKSTTLKIISTILTKTSGTVEVYGYDVEKDSKKVREVISYLPEEAGAYKNLSGNDYLKFMAAMYTDSSSKQKSFVKRGREISNLKDNLKNKVKTYSKGMTRKLLLARTVMTEPKLAILDEPTSGLDVLNSMSIRKTIKSLAKEGMAVLLSSHNMLEIEFLSDRIAIIDKGKIAEEGRPGEMKEKFEVDNLEEVFVSLTSSQKK